MKRFLVTGLVTLTLAGCSSKRPAFLPLPPPPPPAATVRTNRPAVSAPGIVLRFTATKPYSVPWLYPTNINPSAYLWVLQSSTDRVTWVDLPGDCDPPFTNFNTGNIGVSNRYPFEFFRLKGVQ